MDNTNDQHTQPDPLTFVAKALASFQDATADLSATVRNGAQNRWREAMLAIAFAQLAEARKQTAYLNSIESWLIDISGRLEAMQGAPDEPERKPQKPPTPPTPDTTRG